MDKIRLHVYRHKDKTVIDKMLPDAGVSEPTGGNVATELARVPAAGGNQATQHVLQTLVIQQRNLQQQVTEYSQAMITTEQRNRVWLA